MKMRVVADQPLDELPKRDPDSYEVLQLLYEDHGAVTFTLRASDAQGDWSDDRFYGALSRLIRGGFLVAVAEETFH